MKTEYDVIRFNRLENSGGGHEVWECIHKRTANALGVILWYVNEEQYIFGPYEHTYYSASVLRNIVNFLGELNQ